MSVFAAIRPRIRRELESEGRELMNYKKTWLQKLRLDLASTKINTGSNSSSQIPSTLREISAIRHLETQVCFTFELEIKRLISTTHNFHFKVANIQKGVQIFANDMEEASNLDQESRNLLSEIKDQINEIFDEWSRNILAGIRDESLR